MAQFAAQLADHLAEASRVLIPALWLIWLVVWGLAARDVKPSRWRETRRAAIANRLPVLIGAAMLATPVWLPALLSRRLLPGPEPAAAGTILVAAGLGFAIWARWHLGRNWSSSVVVKQDHTLIRTGPYRLVRHPIYSGMGLALIGTALATGEARGFIGAALILAGFIVRLLAEEALMRNTFPEYADYCRRTARLIPGLY
jgi:protein-S-isoprenylcysteine O-methyltransferase Ste14